MSRQFNLNSQGLDLRAIIAKSLGRRLSLSALIAERTRDAAQNNEKLRL